MPEYLGLVKELQSKASHLLPRSPSGCLPTEIGELIESIGSDLPLAYEEFLLWMGQDDGGALGEYRSSINDLDTNSISLRELVEENDLHGVLPEHYLVFMADEGHKYAWFQIPKVSDDPPVYSLTLDEEITEQDISVQESFSGFVLSEMKRAVEDLIEAQAQPDKGGATDFVTVMALPTLEEAHVAQNMLEREGLRVFVHGEGVRSWGVPVMGTVKLQVGKDDVERAQAVLKEKGLLDKAP